MTITSHHILHYYIGKTVCEIGPGLYIVNADYYAMHENPIIAFHDIFLAYSALRIWSACRYLFTLSLDPSQLIKGNAGSDSVMKIAIIALIGLVLSHQLKYVSDA